MAKRSKDYKKMMKSYKKLIMKDAKEASTDPFDWGIGLQVLVDHLYFMRDYYRLGENVWAMEAANMPTREQMLNLILAAYEDWINCEDRYTKIIYKGDEDSKALVDKFVSLGWHLQDDRENPPLKDCYVLYRYPTFKENCEMFVKEYNLNRKKFFECLSDYIEYLWD